MSDEIDEFIRRAAERRKQQGQRKPTPQQRPAPAPVPVPLRERARQRLAQPDVVEAEIVSAELIEDVSASVNKHLGNRQFEQRASQLSETAAAADDVVEARLHKTFDHKLGRLAQSNTGETQPGTVRSATDNAAIVTTAAANDSLLFLINALRTPQMLRQAVIMNEILTRRDEQW
jgi:hypothetical protein